MTVPRGRLLRLAAAAIAAGCIGLFAQAPSYSAASIVNAASFEPGPLAPNQLATVFGQNLSWGTAALSSSDIASGVLPYSLPGFNTLVLIGNTLGHVIYVSPAQVNFLVPSNLLPGRHEVRVVRGVVAGPGITVDIAAASPALFQLDAHTVIATHADGRLVDAASPAAPGEVVVLYATGLGATDPPQLPGVLALGPAIVRELDLVPVQMAGKTIPSGGILYAGLTPGFAGLYQINVRIPDDVPANPEVRIGVPGSQSPAGLMLPVRRP